MSVKTIQSTKSNYNVYLDGDDECLLEIFHKSKTTYYSIDNKGEATLLDGFLVSDLKPEFII